MQLEVHPAECPIARSNKIIKSARKLTRKRWNEDVGLRTERYTFMLVLIGLLCTCTYTRRRYPYLPRAIHASNIDRFRIQKNIPHITPPDANPALKQNKTGPYQTKLDPHKQIHPLRTYPYPAPAPKDA